MNLATREGVTQAVFPEGGLTRDGKLNPAKLGLLSYMLDGFDPASGRDIVFVPVALNYDRVIEDRILTSGTEKAVTGRQFRVRAGTIAGFLGHLLRLRLAGRLYRFGYACVSFGKPLSLARWQRENALEFSGLDTQERFEAINVLGAELMQAIGRVVPVLPVSVAAKIFVEAGGDWIDKAHVERRILATMDAFEAAGAHVHIPRENRAYAVETGLRMLRLRHLVETDDQGRYRASPNEHILLEYYANSIAHLPLHSVDKQDVV